MERVNSRVSGKEKHGLFKWLVTRPFLLHLLCCTHIVDVFLCFWVRSFGMIQIRISDPSSLGLWCIKGTEEFTLGRDSSVPLIQHDPSGPDQDHPKGTHPYF